MLAKVVALESKEGWKDGQRRIVLRFKAAGFGGTDIRIPENELGIIGLNLDDELEVNFAPIRVEAAV